MPSWGTKHRPQGVPFPTTTPPADPVRPVQFPQKSTAGANAESHIVLGMHEPADGRYQSLSRSSYHGSAFGSQSPAVGTGGGGGATVTTAKPHDEIVKEKVEREQHMHNKTFLLSEVEAMPHAMCPITSDKVTATLPPMGASGVGSSSIRSSQLKEVKHVSQTMNMTSLFVSDEDKEEWRRKTNSTNKGDYKPIVGESMRPEDKVDVHHHRLIRRQQGVSNIPIISDAASAKQWQSQSQSAFTDTPELQVNSRAAAVERHRMASSSQGSAVSIGSMQANRKDELRTLKQVDFVAHAISGHSNAKEVASKERQGGLVLGYAPSASSSSGANAKGQESSGSLYRASYTPTVFV